MQIEIIQRMPSWKKIAIVDDLNETVRAFDLSGIKQSHPNANAEQIRRILAERMLGAELAHKVYGHARWLDLTYLRRRANELAVEDLLGRVLAEA